MADPSRLTSTVYVGGLDNAVTTEVLHGAFIPFGDITDISMPKSDLPSSTDPHRGFAYVEFEFADDAREAIDNMDQSELFGRVIKVTQAKPKKEANTGLGSKTAIWQQEGYLAQHNVTEAEQSAGTTAEDGEAPLDPMQGLEGLDVAGPRQGQE